MIDHLPEHLAERVRRLNDKTPPEQRGPVIVWLKSSLRVDENPAIDVGRHIAAAHELPLLIYHGLDERYPHASLRHHEMILDAAVDMDQACRRLGLRYVFHLGREGHRPPVMRSFSAEASCIVTDMFPIPPWNEWVDRVAASAQCPVFDVDCHCVVPMPLFGKSVDRPFKFRDATKRLRKRRIQASWPKCELKTEPFTGPLPFEPVNVQLNLKDPMRRLELLRTCNIDPTVLPVWHERGGEHASLSKWQKFLSNGLNGYARRRNNAADPSGVSRLSHAFHYGFISPMRVAREAAAVGTKSADKYLDELLVFREHAWHHIFSVNDPYSSSNLPGWALDSWRSTSDDPRTLLVHPHRLEHSKSPSELWNLCQRSLVQHGELHNNLRMTWGKALPLWTKDLETSLELGQRLNDKYALDGRDPSSIVGVQWCHGLFDRPFFPQMPVMGVVRKRDLLTHSTRLDLERYESHINRSTTTCDGVYLVYGCGVIESLTARILHEQGWSVVLIKPEQNDVHLNVQRPMKSKWIREQFESIEDFLGTLSSQEITTHLSAGIPVLNPGEVEILTDGPNSVPSLAMHDSSQRIEALISISANGLPSPLGPIEDFDHGALLCSLLPQGEQSHEATHESDIHSAVWNLIEYLWSKNSTQREASTSIQTKLI